MESLLVEGRRLRVRPRRVGVHNSFRQCGNVAEGFVHVAKEVSRGGGVQTLGSYEDRRMLVFENIAEPR